MEHNLDGFYDGSTRIKQVWRGTELVWQEPYPDTLLDMRNKNLTEVDWSRYTNLTKIIATSPSPEFTVCKEDFIHHTELNSFNMNNMDGQETFEYREGITIAGLDDLPNLTDLVLPTTINDIVFNKLPKLVNINLGDISPKYISIGKVNLSDIPVNKYVELNLLQLSDMPNLVELDLTGNIKLKTLRLINVPVTALDVSDCIELTQVRLNDLTEMTPTELVNTLEQLYTHAPNLTDVMIEGNEINNKLLEIIYDLQQAGVTVTYDDAGHVDKLPDVIDESNKGYMSLSNSALGTDDVDAADIRKLLFDNNQLIEFDVKECVSAEYIDVSGNQLTMLDMQYNTSLKTLIATDNMLTKVLLSHPNDISHLELSNNNIYDIDPLHLSGITTILLSNNKLSTDLVSEILVRLDMSGNTNGYVDLTVNNILNTRGHMSLHNLASRGWIVEVDKIESDDIRPDKVLDISNTDIKALDLTKYPYLEELNIKNNDFAYLDISPCLNLRKLNASNNRNMRGVEFGEVKTLVDINLSNCSVAGNLDLSMMTYLNTVSLCNNDLMTLDVYGSTKIIDLDICQNTNLLEVKGLSSLNNLEVFSFVGVPVKFDISSNTKLKNINIDTEYQNPIPITERGVIEKNVTTSLITHRAYAKYVAVNDTHIVATSEFQNSETDSNNLALGGLFLYTMDGMLATMIQDTDADVERRMGRHGVAMSNNRIVTSESIQEVIGYTTEHVDTISVDIWSSDPNINDGATIVGVSELGLEPISMIDNVHLHTEGAIKAPTTGMYTFWFTSDDSGELRLSTDTNQENAVRIAYVDGWAHNSEWDKYPSQQSQQIYLEAGQLYYFEAIANNVVYSARMNISWQQPGGEREVLSPEYVHALHTYNGFDRVVVYDLDGDKVAEINTPGIEDGFIVSGTPDNLFGGDMRVSETHIVVSSRYEDSIVAHKHGAVYIYDINGVMLHRLTQTELKPGAFFGTSIDMYNDMIAVGVNNSYVGKPNHNAGGVEVFNTQGDRLFELDTTDCNLETLAKFGDRVAIGEGGIAVTEPGSDRFGINRGVIHIFELDGSYKTSIPEPQPFSNTHGVNISIESEYLFVTREYMLGIYVYDMEGNLLQVVNAPMSDNAVEFGGTALAIAGNTMVTSTLSEGEVVRDISIYDFYDIAKQPVTPPDTVKYAHKPFDEEESMVLTKLSTHDVRRNCGIDSTHIAVSDSKAGNIVVYTHNMVEYNTIDTDIEPHAIRLGGNKVVVLGCTSLDDITFNINDIPNGAYTVDGALKLQTTSGEKFVFIGGSNSMQCSVWSNSQGTYKLHADVSTIDGMANPTLYVNGVTYPLTVTTNGNIDDFENKWLADVQLNKGYNDIKFEGDSRISFGLSDFRFIAEDIQQHFVEVYTKDGAKAQSISVGYGPISTKMQLEIYDNTAVALYDDGYLYVCDLVNGSLKFLENSDEKIDNIALSQNRLYVAKPGCESNGIVYVEKPGCESNGIVEEYAYNPVNPLTMYLSSVITGEEHGLTGNYRFGSRIAIEGNTLIIAKGNVNKEESVNEIYKYNTHTRVLDTISISETAPNMRFGEDVSIHNGMIAAIETTSVSNEEGRRPHECIHIMDIDGNLINKIGTNGSTHDKIGNTIVLHNDCILTNNGDGKPMKVYKSYPIYADDKDAPTDNLEYYLKMADVNGVVGGKMGYSPSTPINEYSNKYASNLVEKSWVLPKSPQLHLTETTVNIPCASFYGLDFNIYRDVKNIKLDNNKFSVLELENNSKLETLSVVGNPLDRVSLPHSYNIKSVALEGDATSNPIVYNFVDGQGVPTMQGWEVTSQGEYEWIQMLLSSSMDGRLSETNPVLTTKASGADEDFFIGGFEHPVLIARSPNFKVTSPSPITFRSAGGKYSVKPTLGSDPYEPMTAGVSLVRASDGVRVASVNTTGDYYAGTYSMDTFEFTSDGEDYYLEVVDNIKGQWGYLEWCDFVIPQNNNDMATVTLPPTAMGLKDINLTRFEFDVLDLNGYPSLTELVLSDCVANTIDLSELTNVVTLDLNNTSFGNILLNPAIEKVNYFGMRNCGLTEVQVDDIINTLADLGAANAVIDMKENELPSTSTYDNISKLIDGGSQVYVDYYDIATRPVINVDALNLQSRGVNFDTLPALQSMYTAPYPTTVDAHDKTILFNGEGVYYLNMPYTVNDNSMLVFDVRLISKNVDYTTLGIYFVDQDDLNTGYLSESVNLTGLTVEDGWVNASIPLKGFVSNNNYEGIVFTALGESGNGAPLEVAFKDVMLKDKNDPMEIIEGKFVVNTNRYPKIKALTSKYDNSNIDELVVTHSPVLSDIILGATHISELILTGNPYLTYLKLSSKNLTELDLSNNSKIEYIDMTQCTTPIGEIIWGNGHPNLDKLFIDGYNGSEWYAPVAKRLTELKLTNSTTIDVCNIVGYTKLVKLSLSGSTSLSDIVLGSNFSLAEIDLSGLTISMSLYTKLLGVLNDNSASNT